MSNSKSIKNRFFFPSVLVRIRVMEEEKEARVVYNPFILQLLHQRVIYRAKLDKIISHSLQRETIIRDNRLDQSIVTEVTFLLRRLYQQKLQFDPAFVSFEKSLFQAFILFFPKRRTIPEGLCKFNDDPLFGCEDFLLSFLSKIGPNEEENRTSLNDLLLLYLEKYYTFKKGDCVLESKTRVNLFFQLKESSENSVLKNGVLVQYREEQVVTLLYLYLLNELLSFNESLQSEQLHQFQTNPHQPYDERLSRECKLSSLLEKYKKRGSLLRLLYDALMEHHERDLSLSLFESPEESIRLEPNRLGGNGETRRLLKDKEKEGGGGFIVIPKSTNHLVYLKLSKDQHHYRYIVRRFIFDNHLYQNHENLCLSSGGGSCRLCQYFDSDKSIRNLHEFYGIISSGRKELRIFLENLILDRLEHLESLVFKNAWQLLKLVNSSGHLFYLVGVTEMVHEVKLRYEQYPGEGVYRQKLILKNAQAMVKTSNAFRLEKWQEELALDQDIFQLIFAAVMKQTGDLEKHARTHKVDLKITPFLENLNADLCEIFTLYERVLRETMK